MILKRKRGSLKVRTNQCLQLDVRKFVREMPHGWRSMEWPRLGSDKVWRGWAVYVSTVMDLDRHTFRVDWTLEEKVGSQVLKCADTFHLSTTTPHFGGVRWWLHCPGCASRRAIVYLDCPMVEGATFGWRCRRCHRLTYQSEQEHDARVDRLRRRFRESPREVWAIAKCDPDINKRTLALCAIGMESGYA